MIIQGAIIYNSDIEKDTIIQALKKEFENKIKVSVDRVRKIIDYTSFADKTVIA
jgi:uncharacterized protein YihD (DUF1040 family)